MGVLVFVVVVPEAGAQPRDRVTCRGLAANIRGSEGNDTLRGTRGDDIIAGLGGDDIIWGRDGNDLICGGDGKDVINGGNGRDRVYGEAGNDTLHGRGHSDRLIGGVGHDVIYGGEGADAMWGMRGDDLLDGESGVDEASGGLGVDTCLRSSDMDFTCDAAWLHWDLAEVATGGNFPEPRYLPWVDIRHVRYYRGIELYHSNPGTPEYFWWEYDLDGWYRRFVATIGYDDQNTAFQASFRFEVLADGVPVFSRVVTTTEVFGIRVDVAGADRLRLKLTPTASVGGTAFPVWASSLVSASSRLRPFPPTG